MSSGAWPPQRATRARVDLDRIGANLAAIRAHLPGVRVLPVVKANAYGHGAVAVALALERAGADALCVAMLEEGLELREAGVGLPLLVIGPLSAGQLGPAAEAGLTPSVYRPDLLEAVEAAGQKLGRPVGFHLKVDTGMTRLGVSAGDLPALLERLSSCRHARIEGIFSNLACADEPEHPLNGRQISLFDGMARAVAARGLSPGLRHLANSAGLELLPGSRFDAVRPGLLLYGVPPRETGSALPVRPALTLATEIVQVRDIPEGTPVGYGAAFTAGRPMRLALVPAGYDDGLMRVLAQRGHGLVAGRRAPIVGRISMDLAALDVTGCGEISPGEEVVLLGAQGSEAISAWDLARAADTIPWEVLCRIGGRVPRDYVRDGRPAGRWSRWERYVPPPPAGGSGKR